MKLCDAAYAEAERFAEARKKRERDLVIALAEANSYLRSVAEVARRNGAHTNWLKIRDELETLIPKHARLLPATKQFIGWCIVDRGEPQCRPAFFTGNPCCPWSSSVTDACRFATELDADQMIEWVNPSIGVKFPAEAHAFDEPLL